MISMKRCFALYGAFIFASFFIASFLFSGCASTNLASSTDPDYVGKSFKKIVVFADTTDLEIRTKVENTFVQNAKDNNYNAVSWLQLFPATRQHTDSSDDAVLQANGADGFITFSFNGKGAHVQVDQAYYDKKGTFHPEEVHKSQWVKFDATLFDVSHPPNWKKAWVASSTSQTNGESDFSDPFITLINSFSQKVLDDLSTKGLIQK